MALVKENSLLHMVFNNVPPLSSKSFFFFDFLIVRWKNEVNQSVFSSNKKENKSGLAQIWYI